MFVVIYNVILFYNSSLVSLNKKWRPSPLSPNLLDCLEDSGVDFKVDGLTKVPCEVIPVDETGGVKFKVLF